jgi:ABC-type multidrug transport system fused ATPase/permease subunit
MAESRSEREAHIKDRAGWTITVIAALLAVNTYIANGISSSVLTNTIKANDIYSFYQAKSLKQTMAEYAQEDALRAGDKKRAEELQTRITRYESEPATGEGKRELLAKAKELESVRDHAKKQSPWIGIAGSVMQIAIVLLTASILSSGMLMFWAGLGAMGFALVIMAQGLLLFF